MNTGSADVTQAVRWAVRGNKAAQIWKGQSQITLKIKQKNYVHYQQKTTYGMGENTCKSYI